MIFDGFLVGDLVYDSDYGMSGIIINDKYVFYDSDYQEHTWEFLVLFEDGELGGSDGFSLERVVK